MHGERLLKATEAATVLGLSPRTLAQWRHARNRGATVGPDFVRLGGSIRYRLSDLYLWVGRNVVRMAVEVAP